MRLHPLIARTLSLFAVSLAASLVTAQGRVQNAEPVPPVLQDALSITGGTLQRLALPYTEWEPFQVAVVLEGERRVLEVEPFDMRAEGYKIVEYGSFGVREREAPTPTTYRGTVVGLPEAIVAVNLYQGQLSGLILLPDEIWTIQPATEGLSWLPHNAHVVYRQNQLAELTDICGVEIDAEHQLEPVAGSGGGASARQAPLVTEIAAELEPRFRNIWGGVAGSINQATAILNGVDAIYTRDVDITFVITRLVTREAGYPSNSTTVLNQMTGIWNTRAGDIQRDTAHLFMGFPSSGVIGVAYLSTICGNISYSVSWHTSSLTARTAVTAHELGHAFSAQHCNGANPCYIMCSGIGGCSGSITQFAPVSINAITNFAGTRNCLN